MLGVGLPWQHAETDSGYYARALALLGYPHWYNWQASAAHVDDGDYAPMIWQPKLGPHFTKAIEAAQYAPRTTWLLGNEVERQEQADVSPADFVAAIRVWLALVGGKWAGPGILWGDAGRAWLDTYLRIGGPLPTVWAIHIYGSTTVQGWLDQYTDAAIWLDRRVSVRPIWVTETNGSAEIMRYLAARQDVIAFWYSAHDPFGDNRAADLTNANATSLTELGCLFASLQGVGGAGAEMHNQYLPVIRG